MDWRIKQKSLLVGSLSVLDKDNNLSVAPLELPKKWKELKEVDYSVLDEAKGEINITQWHFPDWLERITLEKNLETPVELSSGTVKMVVSSNDLKLGYISAWLKEWDFVDEDGDKLEVEDLYNQHALVLDCHVESFAKELRRLQ